MKKLCLFNRLALYLAFILCVTAPYDTMAQSITTQQTLSFGKIVITDFDTIARITVNDDGSHVNTSNILFFDDPVRGEYTLIGATPSSSFTITAPSSVIVGSHPNGNFVLDNIVIGPSSLSTNGDGQAAFRMTGRLNTLGSGILYTDNVYAENVELILNF